MSSKQRERIKGLHTKENSSTYSDLIPFGSEGQLIDMISTLDLEEEIRLGGNHYAELYQGNDQTIIKEWYYTEPKGNNTKEEMSDLCTYSVKTIFSESPTSTAIEVGEEGEVLVDEADEDETNNSLIVIKDDKLRSIIEISLYKGDFEDEENSILLHEKTIIIDPPNTDGIEIITEDLQEGEV